jgi:hypothetical protein
MNYPANDNGNQRVPNKVPDHSNRGNQQQINQQNSQKNQLSR